MGRPTDYMKTQQQRETYATRARAAILRHMELTSTSQDKLAAKQNVTKRTIQNRLDDPGKMQLQDIWEMAMIMKCPVGEICGGDLPEEVVGKWMAQAMKM